MILSLNNAPQINGILILRILQMHNPIKLIFQLFCCFNEKKNVSPNFRNSCKGKIIETEMETDEMKYTKKKS